MTDKEYMTIALDLAKKGMGRTNPNPMVGAVIVKNGNIIAKGYHKVIGGDHAEVDAFKNASEDVSGATMYVTLEPCSHYGKTPPCAKAIIESGIKKVVVAMQDPNEKVAGKGIAMLKQAGIEVVVGVLEDKAVELNEIFLHYITKKRPFVVMKTASTLDGKIACCTGDSRWVTGKEAREYTHRLRDRLSGIMVGIGTVLADDPSLTTRLNGEGQDPVRIVVDSHGRIPLDSKVICSDSKAKVIIATTDAITREKEQSLVDLGAIIIKAGSDDGRVDLAKLMDRLYELEIDSVLLEGGGQLNASALQAGIVDKVMAFIAPKIVGGKDAKTPVEGVGVCKMDEAITLHSINIEKFGDDILVEGYVNNVHRDN